MDPGAATNLANVSSDLFVRSSSTSFNFSLSSARIVLSFLMFSEVKNNKEIDNYTQV